jgi:hypothetical protein
MPDPHPDRSTAVFVCDNVHVHGRPILFVSHESDGSWQFLCGGQHDDDASDGVALACWERAVALDPSVGELSGMCPHWEAERDAPDAPWSIHDRMEDIVRENVAKYGCHVMLIDEDDTNPAFAFSIGLTRTYGQPELICFGLRSKLMHSMINEVASRYARGEVFREGARLSELIEGFDCELRPMSKARYREYLGYARWFYDGDDFEVFQIVYPDMDGRFPWDEGFTRGDLQPQTW